METISVISVISVGLGIISTCIGIFLSLKNNKKADVDDVKKQVEADTRVNMKLDQIITNQNSQQAEIVSVKNEQNLQEKRIIKVEESVKSAHHRIDKIEDK